MKNITRQSSTIIGTSLVSVSALSLQARPLLAHGGHSNNKVENQDKKQTKDNQQPSPHNAKSENMPQMSSDQKSFVESLKTECSPSSLAKLRKRANLILFDLQMHLTIEQDRT